MCRGPDERGLLCLPAGRGQPELLPPEPGPRVPGPAGPAAVGQLVGPRAAEGEFPRPRRSRPTVVAAVTTAGGPAGLEGAGGWGAGGVVGSARGAGGWR